MKIEITLLAERERFIKNEFPDAKITVCKTDDTMIDVEIDINNSMDAVSLFHAGVMAGGYGMRKPIHD